MPYRQQLLALYADQISIKEDPYLHAHSRNHAVIDRQISIFRRCSELIPESGNILDWGCRHAPDACLVKMLRGDAVQLFGCDVDAEEYRAFADYAKLSYKQITHPFRLPYDDDFFEAVIGSGVLEHVPNDSESLKELYRVLKVGGVFIMTMLPNKMSWTEWLNRRLGNPHHLRLYGLSEAKRLLIHHGFLPIVAGYHQVFPSLSSPKTGGLFDSPLANKLVEKLASYNETVEKVWPVRCFATNLFLIGKKVASFHG